MEREREGKNEGEGWRMTTGLLFKAQFPRSFSST